MRRPAPLLEALAVVAALAACRASTTTPPPPPPPPAIAVSISPAQAALLEDATQLFAAQVTNSDAGVRWSIEESGGGSISAGGLYTAPASPGVFHVVATAQADATRSASSAITVSAPTPPPPPPEPPTDLAYAPSSLSCTVARACSLAAPTHDGGPIDSYAVEPALPAGLSLSVSTGMLSGTPSVVSAAADYTVTGQNDAGSTSAQIAIEVLDQPPADLVYTPDTLSCTLGVPCASGAPTSSGGAVLSYSVSPEPIGVAIDPATGVISGTLLDEYPPAQTLTVTAVNDSGTASTELTVVTVVPPPIIAYHPNPFRCVVGRHCEAPNGGLVNTGGPIDDIAVASLPPAGFEVRAHSGLLDAYPAAIVAPTPVEVNACNEGGCGSTTFTVEAPALALLGGEGSLSAGAFHTCALTNDGVYCWGDNSAGELGTALDGGGLATPVAGLGSAERLAGGDLFACAVAQGAAYCWGDDSSGMLGDDGGAGDFSAAPVPVLGLDAGVQAIAAGSVHACAIVNGGVECWGNNKYGQLGDDTTVNHWTPAPVAGLSSGVEAIAAGSNHTCALAAGQVLCWGDDGNGQLGSTLAGSTKSLTPIAVPGITQAQAIAAGLFHTCALVNGGVRCWGFNADGELGIDNTVEQTSPVIAFGLDAGAQAIAAGAFHTCALVDGAVLCWGSNDENQLGDGTTTDRHVPVQVSGLDGGVRALSLGWYHGCALWGGGVRCWGYGGDGELGNGGTDNSAVALEVDAGLFAESEGAVSAGGDFSCAIINGGVQCWGSNDAGQLGGGAGPSASPVALAGLAAGAQAISAGGAHACAIVNGGAWCWGDDSFDQLGTPDAGPGPLLVPGLEHGVRSLAAGARHTCAEQSGAVLCWGDDGERQLGDDGGTPSGPLRVPMPSGSGAALGGVRVLASGSSASTTCTSASGETFCWGRGSSGQLGDDQSPESDAPVYVAGLGAVDALAQGGAMGCAAANGAAWCWGEGSGGQLGDGTDASALTPVPLPALASGSGAGAGALSAGDAYACGLSNSSVECWGDDQFGQLGSDAGSPAFSPAAIPGLAPAQAISAGRAHACALAADGIDCWGSNDWGQLGQADAGSIGAAGHVPLPGIDVPPSENARRDRR